MKIIWHGQAEADLAEAFGYLPGRDAKAALDVYERIRERVETLAEHPAMGRAGRVEGTREMAVANTRCIVAYMVDRTVDAVVILRVLHGTRLWPEGFDDVTY